jgi:hypothetical protein
MNYKTSLLMGYIIAFISMIYLSAMAMLPVYFLWNYVMPQVLGLHTISVFDAFMIMLLVNVVSFFRFKVDGYQYTSTEKAPKSKKNKQYDYDELPKV